MFYCIDLFSYILFQYQYNTSHISSTIQTLVQLVINMIDTHIHRCKTNEDAVGPASPVIPRNRGTHFKSFMHTSLFEFIIKYFGILSKKYNRDVICLCLLYVMSLN